MAMWMRMPVLSALVHYFTALSAVWCLGCCAFDPIVDAMFGANAAVVSCESAMRQSGADGTGSHSAALALDESGTRDGVVCGCTSCVSVTPSPLARIAQRLPTPAAEPLVLVAPLSVARTPIAPPPEPGTL